MRRFRKKGSPATPLPVWELVFRDRVNEDGAVICAVNLHWGYVELEKELEKLTGLTVKAGNDANVAALGEMWKGGGAATTMLLW